MRLTSAEHPVLIFITQSPNLIPQSPNPPLPKDIFPWLGRGQSALEYAIVMVIVIVALAGLRTYALYALQGRLNDSRIMLIDQTPSLDPKAGADSTWSYTFEITPSQPETNEAVASEFQIPDLDGTPMTRHGIRTRSHTYFQEATAVTQNGR